MEYEDVINTLKSKANPAKVEGMARFGINPGGTLGIPVKDLRVLAKEIGTDHGLALRLWDSGIHEARMLATLVEDPGEMTGNQAEGWVLDLDSWDTCDGLCFNVLWKTPFAYDKCFEWATREEEYARRAGFALMAKLALSDKKASDERIAAFLPAIKKASTDERNFVKKAVNWALRQIGKRNAALNEQALATAREIQSLDTASSKWIAKDAIRELEGDAVRKRLAGR